MDQILVAIIASTSTPAGRRASREDLASVDASGARVLLTLRTGVIQPAALWELTRA